LYALDDWEVDLSKANTLTAKTNGLKIHFEWLEIDSALLKQYYEKADNTLSCILAGEEGQLISDNNKLKAFRVYDKHILQVTLDGLMEEYNLNLFNRSLHHITFDIDVSRNLYIVENSEFHFSFKYLYNKFPSVLLQSNVACILQSTLGSIEISVFPPKYFKNFADYMQNVVASLEKTPKIRKKVVVGGITCEKVQYVANTFGSKMTSVHVPLGAKQNMGIIAFAWLEGCAHYGEEILNSFSIW